MPKECLQISLHPWHIRLITFSQSPLQICNAHPPHRRNLRLAHHEHSVLGIPAEEVHIFEAVTPPQAVLLGGDREGEFQPVVVVVVAAASPLPRRTFSVQHDPQFLGKLPPRRLPRIVDAGLDVSRRANVPPSGEGVLRLGPLLHHDEAPRGVDDPHVDGPVPVSVGVDPSPRPPAAGGDGTVGVNVEDGGRGRRGEHHVEELGGVLRV
eukprot:CAMPEP_0113566068 /NCGR_PEP_ID=MMETSP0015_2-20120614/22523_1 /TAXON_ID=2838 /ORGANISM="Odontella" /LENGTH=208 /DNA_ID=CAMNT_0000468327 /DNA_START=103 /DNA_END=729 /DNA_ORIENTATION=- /assembly_acc=CAM_ASM_000160